MSVSNLVKNHLPRIVSETENYHLSKRPGDAKDIKDMADGFISAIKN